MKTLISTFSSLSSKKEKTFVGKEQKIITCFLLCYFESCLVLIEMGSPEVEVRSFKKQGGRV